MFEVEIMWLLVAWRSVNSVVVLMHTVDPRWAFEAFLSTSLWRAGLGEWDERRLHCLYSGADGFESPAAIQMV